MESRNPVFNRTEEFKRGGYATFDAAPRGRGASSGPSPYGYGGTPQDLSPDQLRDMYAAESAGPARTGRMTLDDVVVRTALVFGVLVLAAGATYTLLEPDQLGIALIAALVGFGLAMVNSFKREPSPPLILAYAAVEGVFVGGISLAYETRFDGIVAQAVLGTLSAFAAMLGLYKIGAVRATPKFRRMLLIAGVGYMVFALVHLLGVMFGAWSSVYSTGGLGLLLSAVGVVLASLFLVLDFDFVESGIRNGIPQRYAWTAAFGLVVTLVWLYLEMLRLLAILRGND
ncbi:MAG: Bax inhibitor-1/YccA family protein [Kineosporiaceae bacterium]